MKPLTRTPLPAIVAVAVVIGAAMPAQAALGRGKMTAGAALSNSADSQGRQNGAPRPADVVCRVFVEQDDFSAPLNKNGTTATPNKIDGATVGCSSPNGEFARGNRDHHPVLLSSTYTSVGGPSVNNVTELNHNCTTITQNAVLEFTWNTGDVSIGRLAIDGSGKTTARILAGVLAGDSFTFTGPAVDRIDSYLTYLGSCSPTHTTGEADGFIFNPWLPAETGSTGHEIGLTFARQ
jgi:hypothetical protein